MEEIITSASNATVKRLRKLISSSKARSDENMYVAEGIHLATSFLASGGIPELYACATSALSNPEIIELSKKLDAKTVRRVVITDSLFESIASIHSSVGILLLFSPSDRDNQLEAPLSDDAVLLENIQDPGNLGTILRTAAAVGINTVALSPRSASPWSPKALRAGMGAQFSLIIHENADILEIADKANVPVLATTLAPGSQSLYDIDLSQPVAWVMGNEGQGVSEVLARQADSRIFIPQTDGPVESLNVAAATAVCLYEQYRQRLNSYKT